MAKYSVVVSILSLLYGFLDTSTAFTTPQQTITTLASLSNKRHQKQQQYSQPYNFSPSRNGKNFRPSSELYIWKKLFNKKNDTIEVDVNITNIDEKPDDIIEDTEEPTEVEKERKRVSFRSRIPFIASRASSSSSSESKTITDTSDTTVTTTSTTTATSTPETPVKKDDPLAYAKELKRQATKARLEAEKMDAQLTLEKIASLEKKLDHSKSEELDMKEGMEANGSSKGKSKQEDIEEIQNQILILKKKLNGESSTPVKESTSSTSTTISTSPTPTTAATTTAIPGTISSPTTPESTKKESIFGIESQIKPITSEELEKREKAFLQTPKFLRQITAKAAGFDEPLTDSTNITAIVEKMYMDEQRYLFATSISDSSRVLENVELSPEKQKELAASVETFEKLPDFLKILTAKSAGVYEEGKEINATKVMLTIEMMVENDNEMMGSFSSSSSSSSTTTSSQSEESTSSASTDNNMSKLFRDPVEGMDEETQMIESLFPKSTRKENEEPTSAQMDLLYSQVLDSKIFSASGKPERIPGGYLVRGTNSKDNGDEMMEALEEKLQNSALANSVSVFYVKDPSPVTEEQMQSLERPPVLFVTGSNVFKNSNPFLTTLATAFGISGISFLSVYPFLLNDDVYDKVREQVELSADVNFLDDLTSPIFFTFILIQVAHEVAHLVISKLNGFNAALVPAWVPSPLIGLTSSITALRSSPKNKTALFDFALAGPVTGMLLSLLAIYTGLELTVNLDTAAYNALPTLPVSFLQQSSLAGGLIEAVLGPDTLTGVSNPAVATMHVHPYVVAGYAALMVNALNLTPFGRTDGGRISMALFGRSGAQLVGLLTMLTLFVGGIFSSDVLLLHFAFVLFYQSELEIPMKNEVDEVDFGRAVLAIATGVLVLLTLIPM